MLRQTGLVIALAVIAGLVFQTWRVSQLKDRNAALEATVEGYKEAARIHQKYLESREALLRDNDALMRDLQEMEGRDAPLSDHLRGAAGRVWPNP